LYCDPSAREQMKRDADDWIYTERITHKAFEQRYGKKAQKVDFEVDDEFEDDWDDEWTDEETVRIAEYWYKQPVKKELWLLEDGTVVDSTSDEATPEVRKLATQTREVKTHQICMVEVSGQAILTGPHKWAGRHFPWVMVYGDFKNIEGRNYWWGLTRFAKDAQRNYNISKTAIAETIAQAPKAKWWATSKQAEGHTDEWADADAKNYPYLLYEADPATGGREPQRMGGADVPAALLQQAGVDNEDLKDVMGLPDASMGNEGNEKSGRAIYARQQQGAVATFNFPDNMAKAVEYTMELLIDLIPEIYDTERELRVLGEDGVEDYMRVNQVVMGENDKPVRINDLSAGKYDVTVTTGPSFSTLRQEAAEIYGNLTQQFPQIMGVAGDLIMQSMDLPYADQMAERFKALLPPEIQQRMNQDQEVPPEVQVMMQQAEAAMAEVQKHGQLVQAAAQELAEKQAENEKLQADIKTELANVRAAKAEFDAHIAEEMSKIIQAAAGLTEKQAGLAMKGAEVKEAAITASQAIDGREDSALDISTKVDHLLAGFMRAVDDALDNIKAKERQLEAKTDRVPIGGTTRREGGRITANIEFDDGTEKEISAVREQGGLRIVPTE